MAANRTIAGTSNRLLDRRVRVARARRFMEIHRTEEFQLETVAHASGTSVFHLARLHRAITGETLGQARTRLRLERAVELLRGPRSVSEIALEVGFQTPSSFAKAFRAAFGISASEFRHAPPGDQRRRFAALSRPARAAYALAVEPEIRALDAMRVAFVREHGAYAEVAAPLAWARLAGCLADTALAVSARVGVSHDDPLAVRAESLRYDACVVLAGEQLAPAGTNEGTCGGGDYAMFEYRGDYRWIAAAFREIFERHAIRRRQAPCVELYREDAVTELGIPV